MTEEKVAVEYISLHRYIGNIPSDREVHAEHQLGVPDQWKRIYRITQNSVGQRN